MKDKELLKWGFGFWIGYKILKEINSNGSQPPQPSQNSPTNPDIRRIIEESLRAAFDTVFKKPDLLEPQIPKPSPEPQTIEAEKWLKLIRHPSIVLILGKRGSGKSALGYRILEHLRYTATPYVVALPQEARKLLPDWIGMAVGLEGYPTKICCRSG